MDYVAVAWKADAAISLPFGAASSGVPNPLLLLSSSVPPAIFPSVSRWSSVYAIMKSLTVPSTARFLQKVRQNWNSAQAPTVQSTHTTAWLPVSLISCSMPSLGPAARKAD
mgnify:CR=1 FL=1|jgi:hypothetical protein